MSKAYKASKSLTKPFPPHGALGSDLGPLTEVCDPSHTARVSERGEMLPVVQTHFRMTAAHVQYVRDVVGYRVVTETGTRVNKHGPAAVERLLAERHVIKAFAEEFPRGSVLCDVGSNAVRITQSAAVLGVEIKFKHLIPHIVPNDVSRQNGARANRIPFTTQRLEELDPPNVDNFVSAFNFTHSLYYFEPTELITAMVKQAVHVAYASGHDFTQACARICGGTVSYNYTDTGRIRCQADGDALVYSHAAGHWLFEPGYQAYINSKPWILTWTTLTRFGDTIVRRFELREGVLPVGHEQRNLDILPSVDESTANIGQSLALVTALNRELKSVNIDMAYVPVVDATIFFGMYGVTTGKGRFIPIPRGLVGRCRLKALGQVRTPALYQLLLAHAREMLSQLNYPSDMAPEAAVYAAVTALVADVELEVASLGTISRWFTRLFGQHRRVLDFEPVYLYTARQLVTAVAVSSPVLIPFHYYGLDGSAVIALKALGMAALAHPFVSLPAIAAGVLYARMEYLKTVAHKRAAAETWLAFRRNLSPGGTSATITFDANPRFYAAHTPKTSVYVPQRAGATLMVRGDLEAEPPRGLSRAGLTLYGIAMQEVTPSYIAKTPHAAIEGLRTRVLAEPTYKSDKNKWALLENKLKESTSVLNKFALGKLRNWNAGTFEFWVARYPPAVAARLKEARTSLSARPIEDDDLRVEAIVKQEKTGTLDISGVTPEADPRIVLSCSARANVELGPYHWTVGTILKKRFYPRNNVWLAWSNAESSEELGAWFDWATTHFSATKPVEYMLWDQDRFDKNQGANSYGFESQTMILSGATPQIVRWDRRLKTIRGKVQSYPITFQVDEPQRISGGNDTSSGNFKINAACVVHVLGEPGPDTYAVCIKGDDALIVAAQGFFPSAAETRSRASQLGLSVTAVVTNRLADVEFASNLPYPSADGTVFAPKIGRTLHRFGWTLSSAPPDVYGAASSLTETVNHVPFLRQFIEAHRRLSDPSDLRYFRYKMLANTRHSATAETYAFIQERYGLTAALEDGFEEMLREVTSLPAAISWPLVETLVARDL